MFKTEVTFFYPHGSTLTGQELASKQIVELLAEKNYRFDTVKLPVFDRSRPWSIIHLFHFLRQIAYVWWRFFALPVNRFAVVYLNLGQSFKALVCDGLPFLLCSFIKPGIKCVISLHGHFFCTWRVQDLRFFLLIRILRRARLITVLGPIQRQRLVEVGIPSERICIVNNTCERAIQPAKTAVKKNCTINLLYLNNLIEAKGYKDYLLALLHISRMAYCPVHIHAVLCGKLVQTSLDDSDANSNDEAWIRQTIETINESYFIDAVWTQGAYGSDKAELFSRADIFVYPSRVDAQPIVLIEAMASGCAIITSNVGEIPAMLDGSVGLVLCNCTPEIIAESILDLINDSTRLMNLKNAALARYESKFNRATYEAAWHGIFVELSKPMIMRERC